MNVKPPEAFPREETYEQHLGMMFRRGAIQETTVTPDLGHTMLDGVFASQLQPGVYLEIGCGTSPYVLGSSRRFSTESRYLGLEGGRADYHDDHRSYGQTLARAFTYPMSWGEWRAPQLMAGTNAAIAAAHKETIAQVMWADAKALPLPTRVTANMPVRETFVRNVLALTHWKTIRLICAEQARVLGSEGLFIIRETDPRMRQTPSYLEMLAELDRTGFGKRVLVHQADVLGPLMRQYPGTAEHSSWPTGYYLICQQGQGDGVPGRRKFSPYAYLATLINRRERRH